MKLFCWGALAMAGGIAALFFIHSWRISGDRLFVYFASAFGVMSLQWIALAASDPALEAHQMVYIVRLAAFVLLVVGIVDKNRRNSRS